MSRIVRIVAAAAVAATFVFSAVLNAPASGASGSDQAAFVAQINGARAARGLGALIVNGSLTSVAQNWAAQMAGAGALAHNPNLGSQVPPGWRFIEENVGMGSNDAAIESSFATSPDHYDNMVNSGVNEVGVGVVSARGYLWVVEDFWGGNASGVAPAPVAAPPPITRQGGTPAPPGSGASGSRGLWTTPAASTGATIGGSTAARGQRPGAGVGVGFGLGLARLPAPSVTAPAASGPPPDLNTIANQVQYFDTWD